jgi:division/cell wall cluster transcriptional repressor MraZ
MAVKSPNILHGEPRHALDEKNRLIVPSSMRAKGAKELIIVRHPNSYLSVFTPEQFDSLYQSLVEKNKEPKERRSFVFMMNHVARTVPVDAQGRMSLSQPEVEHVGPGREVVFTRGSERSSFEIWNTARHDAATTNERDRFRVTLETEGV